MFLYKYKDLKYFKFFECWGGGGRVIQNHYITSLYYIIHNHYILSFSAHIFIVHSDTNYLPSKTVSILVRIET